MIMWLSHTQKDPIYWNIVLIYFDCDINDNSLDILTWEPLKSNIIPEFLLLLQFALPGYLFTLTVFVERIQ